MTDDRTPRDSLTDPIPTLAPVPPPTFTAPPPPPPAVPARRRPGPGIMSIVLGIAVLFAVGGVAFAAGRLTAPPAARDTAGTGGSPFGAGRGNGNGNGFGAGGNGGNPFGGGAGLGAAGLSIKGTVTAVAADHLTIELPGGQTVDIPIDSSTAFHRQSGASRTDLAMGASVEIALSGRFGRAGGANGGASASAAPSGATGAGRALGPATDVTITGG